MAGDFRFGSPENTAGKVASGGGDVWGALGNAITSRANARAMRDAQSNAAVANAYAQIHTNETNIRTAQIEAESKAQSELNEIAHTRAKSLAARQEIASRAVAEQGAATVLMDFAERNADKGHTVDVNHSIDKGTRIQLTPASAKEPESEGDL